MYIYIYISFCFGMQGYVFSVSLLFLGHSNDDGKEQFVKI